MFFYNVYLEFKGEDGLIRHEYVDVSLFLQTFPSSTPFVLLPCSKESHTCENIPQITTKCGKAGIQGESISQGCILRLVRGTFTSKICLILLVKQTERRRDRENRSSIHWLIHQMATTWPPNGLI